MTKRTVRETLDDISPREFEGKLTDVLVRVQDLLGRYGPNAKLDWDPDFWYAYDTSPTPRYNVLNDREETDDEYKKRLADAALHEQTKVERDRAEFERLNKIFGAK